jgi:hypothetical protein
MIPGVGKFKPITDKGLGIADGLFGKKSKAKISTASGRAGVQPFISGEQLEDNSKRMTRKGFITPGGGSLNRS